MLSNQSRLGVDKLLEKPGFNQFKLILDNEGWRAEEARLMLGDAHRRFDFHQDTFTTTFWRILMTGDSSAGQEAADLVVELSQNPHSDPRKGYRVVGADGEKTRHYPKDHASIVLKDARAAGVISGAVHAVVPAGGCDGRTRKRGG